ncbi:MAG: hypothetical protein WAW41_16450 [Methylobacter sp.]
MAQISVKTFEEADLEGFLEMSQLEYGATVSSNAEHIRWKHLDSQFGASLYVNLAENGRVVGRALIQPRSLYTSSKVIDLGQVMDLLIDKVHRSTPVNFINITKACGDIESFDLVFHTSNERSFPLYSKLFRFASPFSLKAYGFPVRLAGIFSSIIGRRVDAIDWLTAPLRWVIEKIADAVTSIAGLEISQRAMSDDELKVLCAKCLRQSESHLARTTAFLKWRFSDAPLWPATVHRLDWKGKFLGYIVTRKVELGGLSHLVVMDFILDPDTPGIVRVALRLWLIRQAIISQADSLFTMVNPFNAIARRCVGFPLISIPDSLLPHATPIFMRSRTNESKELEADRSIHLTLADLDYF